MGRSEPAGVGVRFGAFEVDPEAGELRKSGMRLKIQEQPFRVLALLLERPGKIVSREELRHRIWPDDTFVDFEQGLNSAVNRARAVLDDSATHPRFIETVPRKGYRFVAPVQEFGAPAPPPVRRRNWLRVAPLAFVVAIAGAAVWYFTSRADPPEAPLEPVPLTSYAGSEVNPSLSPDGAQVAFAWNGADPDNYDIYVKVVGSEKALRLTTDPAKDDSPAWSPDGRHIAFLRRADQGKSQVLLISPLGGPERKLIEVSPYQDLEHIDSRLAWHPDGKHLAVVDRATQGQANALFLCQTGGAGKRRLTAPPAECAPWGDTGPAFSPDGRRLVFVRSGGAYVSELYLLSLSEDIEPKEEPVQLTSANRRSGGAAWFPDGGEIVFSLGKLAPQSKRLWRISASGSGEPRRLMSLGEDEIYPTIARQGHRMAYTRRVWDIDIWRFDLDSASAGKAVSWVRLFDSTLPDASPDYSPDGEKIAFVSGRSGYREIWVSGVDGSNPLQLTHFKRHAEGPAWSPDGQSIAFGYMSEGQSDIYVMSSQGGASRRLTDNAAADGAQSWSRDGMWIYFRSNRSGSDQVWKIPAGGGEAVQVTQHGGFAPIESLDGRFLYYSKRGTAQPSLWRIPVEGGEEVQFLDSLDGGGAYTVAEKGVYFIAPPSRHGQYVLSLRDAASGRIEEITEIPGKRHWRPSVSPDGRSVLCSLLQAGDDLMLVENFQ